MKDRRPSARRSPVLKRSLQIIACTVLLLPVNVSIAAVSQVEKAQRQQAKTIYSGIRSQQAIDGLDDETQTLETEIKAHQQKLKTLKKYNQRMATLIGHQHEELRRLTEETQRVTHLDREMLPLVEDMLANLEAFIATDTPFLPKERSERIQHLNAMLNRADVSVAEKFRRVLEAYQIESEFGRTLEVYQGPLADSQQVVDFLRIGRNLLFYKSQNNKDIARWNPIQKAWRPVDKKTHREIKKAFLVANNQRAPELLLLPVPKAEQQREAAQ
ncbi:MAG: DUF3450 domain-containing protein [Gammaproteobacteria bacterium]|nr:DUF3450 domain-containing protein [Gammaproteobacteria bacterium]